jgi:hypothetical protein
MVRRICTAADREILSGASSARWPEGPTQRHALSEEQSQAAISKPPRRLAEAGTFTPSGGPTNRSVTSSTRRLRRRPARATRQSPGWRGSHRLHGVYMSIRVGMKRSSCHSHFLNDFKGLLAPPAGFEPTTPGLGNQHPNLPDLTPAHLSLENRGFSPSDITPDDARSAGRGHFVDTEETSQTPASEPPGDLAPERPVDLKVRESKARPQDILSRGKRKP